MNLQEIIKALSKRHAVFPEQALVAARDNWFSLLSEVYRVLNRAIDKEALSNKEQHFLFWGILLLADRKEYASYEMLVDFCEQEVTRSNVIEYVLGDAITELLPSILYILSKGKVSPLNRLMLSVETASIIKIGLIDIFSEMLRNQSLDKNFIAVNAPLWIESCISKREFDLLSRIAELLIDTQLTSFQPMFLDFFTKGYIESEFLNKSEIQNWDYDARKNRNYAIANSFDILSISDWDSFQENPEAAMDFYDSTPDYDFSAATSAKKLPSRNDPCFCGSGKKYKKCCLG